MESRVCTADLEHVIPLDPRSPISHRLDLEISPPGQSTVHVSFIVFIGLVTSDVPSGADPSTAEWVPNFDTFVRFRL